MTKPKAAAKAAAPAPAPQQPPAPPPTGDDTTVNPVHDEAGAPPPEVPTDPVPPEPRLPPVLASFTRLEVVRGLPEVVGDIDTQPVEFAEGSIQRFKASETDRRTMEVIALPGQGFAVRAVADIPQEA